VTGVSPLRLIRVFFRGRFRRPDWLIWVGLLLAGLLAGLSGKPASPSRPSSPVERTTTVWGLRHTGPYLRVRPATPGLSPVAA